MMRLTSVVALFPDLREPDVMAWVERGWVRPQYSRPEHTGPEPGGPEPGGPEHSGPKQGVPEQGAPEHRGEDWVFQDIDVARVRLIRDLRYVMAVQEETMPLVLSLLDQVYALRGQMQAMARAVEAQDEAVRSAILATLRG